MRNQEIINQTEYLRLIYTQYIKLIKTILENYDSNKEIKYHQKITANILQRIYTSIKAIVILLDEFYINKNIKFPIGIQMRVALLDVITLAYLALHIDEDNEELFKGQITRLDNNIAKDYFNEINSEFKRNKIDKNEKDKRNNFLLENFPNNIIKKDNEIDLNKSVKNLTTKQMADYLFGTCYQSLITSYNLYQYYSKYEHFQTISKTFLDFDSEYDFDKLKYSSCFVFQASLMACNIMKVENSNVIEMKDLLINISKIEPSFK